MMNLVIAKAHWSVNGTSVNIPGTSRDSTGWTGFVATLHILWENGAGNADRVLPTPKKFSEKLAESVQLMEQASPSSERTQKRGCGNASATSLYFMVDPRGLEPRTNRL